MLQVPILIVKMRMAQSHKEIGVQRLAGEALLPLEPLQHQGRIPEDARTVRTRFMNYFMAEGEVPWQYQAVGAGNF